jgi:hypothetical protein
MPFKKYFCPIKKESILFQKKQNKFQFETPRQIQDSKGKTACTQTKTLLYFNFADMQREREREAINPK